MSCFESGQLIAIDEISDGRGALISLESLKNIPFDIKRVYCLYDLKENRGYHAHKKLKQVILCLSGGVKISLESSNGKTEHYLNDRSKGLFIGPGTWRVMSEFEAGTVIMVLADELYDETDYIRDYEVFKTGAF